MDPSVTIIITLALVFYSIGVWSERISGIINLIEKQLPLYWSYMFTCICQSWNS